LVVLISVAGAGLILAGLIGAFYLRPNGRWPSAWARPWSC